MHELPPGFVPRPLALGATAAVPRGAATVVLLRDGAGGPEAYLVRRVLGMAFAGGMTAFPGGSVDPSDGVTSVPWSGPAPAAWADRLGADEASARALVCAAVRETFEESGVLLAGLTPAEVVPDVSDASWEAERVALESHTQTLSELLGRRRLLLRADLLRPWSHWITPEGEPRRYDTRFFVAALPEGQLTRHVGGEADRVQWMRPADALAAQRRGELPMLLPTAVTLEQLSGYPDVPAVLKAADARQIFPVLPRLVDAGDRVLIALPGESGYDA